MATDPSATTARILVIDDEAGVREGCRRVLTEAGYEADVVASAEEGLRLLPEHDYLLAFVDLKMPGMDGLEFLAAAGETPTETVFVVITAYATLATAVDATKRGAYDFVAKPFTPDELLGVTEKALDWARLLRERNRLYEERERRLLELTTEKGRLRSIVEAMSDGVIVVNREGRVVLRNAAADALTRGSLGGEAGQVRETIDVPELVALIEEAQRGGGVKRLGREVRVGAQPHEVILASVSPVLDDAGACLGAVVVLSDVSELKKIEAVKAQFVSMVAHELRAPLAAVDTHLVGILQGYVVAPEQQQHSLERAHARLQALLGLVNDLLAISRMDTKSVRREIRPLDLGALAAEACALMQPTAAERGISLTLDVAPALPPLEADAQEMNALLSNLLSNALKYNRDEGSVTVGLRAEGQALVLTVADTGVGISPEGLTRIFDEFFREKTEETQLVTGTGLGLSIVQRLVDGYHGQISVASELGEGTTFTVRLPLTQSSGE
jgi:signal transduction histidine kinase